MVRSFVGRMVVFGRCIAAGSLRRRVNCRSHTLCNRLHLRYAAARRPLQPAAEFCDRGLRGDCNALAGNQLRRGELAVGRPFQAVSSAREGRAAFPRVSPEGTAVNSPGRQRL